MPRALIIKLGAIGDVVMAIPAAFALHRSGYVVDWICGAQVQPVLACYPWIRTIPVDETLLLRGGVVSRARELLGIWLAVAGPRYEICATLYYDPRYRMLAAPVRARRKLRLSETDRQLRLLPGRHHTDEYARIVLGIEDGQRPLATSPVPVPVERLPASPIGPVPPAGRIVLAPGGAKNLMRDDALRRWPTESYVDVARILLEQGRDVVLIGGPDDGWISAAFTGMAVVDMIGRTTLPEMLAVLSASDVLVTHDTGPLHLAGITNAGLIGIFGPTDPRGRVPQRSDTVALWGGEGFACRPCYDGRTYAPCQHNGCVRQVTARMVVGEVNRLMEQRRSGRSSKPRIVTPESTVGAETEGP